MKVLKKIIEYIIVFILSIIILGLFAINLISSTILKKDYVLAQLEKTGYYDEMYKHVEENFKNYIGQSGLEEDVFEGVITKDLIKTDTNKILENIYDGKENEIEIETLKEKLNDNIYKQLTSRQNKINESQKKSVEQFIENISKEYKTSILNTKYETKINNIYIRVIKYKDIVYKALAVTMGVLIVLLIVLNIKSICSFFVEIGVSILTGAVFLVFSYIFINSKININNIVLFNEAFEKVVRNILANILGNLITYGAIMGALGISFILIFNLVQNMKNNNKKGERYKA